jgi:predicted O-methyltransferase YrrM
LARATRRAKELGCPALPPAAGALLSVLTAALHAHAVVEVGTCVGITSHWLLRGMPHDGVLTVIDPRSEHLRAAQRTYADAGIAPGRTRSIAGSPDQVLPRLADSAYDLVLIGGDPRTWQAYSVEALRLLRPGGILVVDGTSVGERSDDAAAARDLAGAVWDDDRLLPALVPIGGGLLLAVTTGS